MSSNIRFEETHAGRAGMVSRFIGKSEAECVATRSSLGFERAVPKSVCCCFLANGFDCVGERFVGRDNFNRFAGFGTDECLPKG